MEKEEGGYCCIDPGAKSEARFGPFGMAWKRKVTGGILALVGYLLSPLSWWNDLFVNVPLAVAFAWVVSFFYHPIFEPSLILGYWLTNVLGFVLLHKGAQGALSKADKRYARRELLRDIGISLVYTAIIVALAEAGMLKPVVHYFDNGS
jgi:hypothetical protein